MVHLTLDLTKRFVSTFVRGVLGSVRTLHAQTSARLLTRLPAQSNNEMMSCHRCNDVMMSFCEPRRWPGSQACSSGHTRCLRHAISILLFCSNVLDGGRKTIQFQTVLTGSVIYYNTVNSRDSPFTRCGLCMVTWRMWNSIAWQYMMAYLFFAI